MTVSSYYASFAEEEVVGEDRQVVDDQQYSLMKDESSVSCRGYKLLERNDAEEVESCPFTKNKGRVTAASSSISDSSASDTDLTTKEQPTDSISVLRKTGVAVAGGAMVGIGLIMIPLPTPFGAVIAGSGMAVLGTEFPAAQRILDQTCNKVADVIERSVSSVGEEGYENLEQRDAGYQNQKMKDLMNEKQSKPFDLQKSVKEVGKKAVPIIRQIGKGIDKDELSRNLSQAAESTSQTLSQAAKQTQESVVKAWKHMLVIDDDEELKSPFLCENSKTIQMEKKRRHPNCNTS